MIAVIPSAGYGRAGAVLSALIIVLCIIGLTLHPDFYAGNIRRDFFFFYTNLSTLLVLIYFALLAPRLYASPSLHTLIAPVEFAVMMCMMLTGSVFHLLLLPVVRRRILEMPRTRTFRMVVANNLIVHYLVPLTVLAYWLLCSPGKEALRLADALRWTIVPVLYVTAVFLRVPRRGIIAETGTPYPYPFLDTHVLGLRRVLLFLARLYGLCAAVGAAVVLTLRMLFLLLGSNHTWILI